MSRWVLALLNKGDLGNGKRLFSEAQARTLWTPLTILPIGDSPAETIESQAHFADYAMGEVLRDYRGHLLVTHTGGLQGMVSIVAMLPELHLGVVFSPIRSPTPRSNPSPTPCSAITWKHRRKTGSVQWLRWSNATWRKRRRQ